MEINIKKREVLLVTKGKNIPVCNVLLNDTERKQVPYFKYLGCTLSTDCREDRELSIQIGQAKNAFNTMRSILTNKHLLYKCRYRALKRCVYQILTYCAKTWTLSKRHEIRINAFKMLCIRCMQRISWKDMKTNEEVLLKAGLKLNQLENSREWQIAILGTLHAERETGTFINNWKVPWKCARGRARTTFLQQFPVTAIEIIHNANECDNWKQFSYKVINIWNRRDT